MAALGLLFLGGTLASWTAEKKKVTVSVTCASASVGDCTYEHKEVRGYTARAVYDLQPREKAGFANLIVSSNIGSDSCGQQDLETTYFAAGYAEGIATAQDIHDFSCNVIPDDVEQHTDLINFIKENDEYVRTRISDIDESSEDSEYWKEVSLAYKRFDGIFEGYKEAVDLNMKGAACSEDCYSEKLTMLKFLLVNLDGDLFDLMSKFSNEAIFTELGRHGRVQASLNMFKSRLPATTTIFPNGLRCSALFKVADDDIFFAHDTWDTYSTAAPRIFKHVQLPTQKCFLRTTSYSSSPGFLSSIDDYYVVKEEGENEGGGSSFVVIETSNNIYSKSAYDACVPQSVFSFARATVANNLASTAPEWARLFATNASGTYNNQWMILDLNLYHKNNEKLVGDCFWVLEEVPGAIEMQDQTQKLLEDGYWGSYNVAYYQKTRLVAGETDLYGDNIRANIFREEQGNVTDIASMQKLMALNRNAAHPGWAINARFDLYESQPDDAGGIDSKVSSAMNIAQDMITYARGGPTHDDVSKFCWSDNEDLARETPHCSHPQCFNYDWATFSPGSSAVSPSLYVETDKERVTRRHRRGFPTLQR
uniref:Phospholipase B-like n=1 Tax=Lotharella globosa TaxID=91324 RepID=A0A7S3ZEI1_9EUKA